MDPLAANPFAVLTFIAAPAILINASSVMALGTSNRFARAIDRARRLSDQLDQHDNTDPTETQFRVTQLAHAERRVLFLVRALTAFYLSVGSFAAASLASLLGAIVIYARIDHLHSIAWWIALPVGIVGVCGLMSGAGLLVWESRTTLTALRLETQRMRTRASHVSIEVM